MQLKYLKAPEDSIMRTVVPKGCKVFLWSFTKHDWINKSDYDIMTHEEKIMVRFFIAINKKNATKKVLKYSIELINKNK